MREKGEDVISSMLYNASKPIFAIVLGSRYTPTWQSYPIAPGQGFGYNWNAIMDPLLGPGIERAISQKEAVLTQALNLAGKDDPSHVQNAANHTYEWASTLSGSDTNTSEPLVRFIYPVLRSALVVQESSLFRVSDVDVVAVMVSSFYFGTLLRGILPAGQDGLIVVVDNECGLPFTYQVNGAEPIFLGEGDLHDDLFSNYAISVNLTELGDFIIGDELEQFYTGLPIADTYCRYNITIYPSEVMEDKYRSNDPIIFTYSVIAIFLFTSICFLGYDKLVADRQQKVVRSAQQSNAIISSLFPSNIRDRLFVDGANGIARPTKARLKHFLHDEDESSNSRTGGDMRAKLNAERPIADFFTDCTVMFADIAGTSLNTVEIDDLFMLLPHLLTVFNRLYSMV
jgi:hypothetical protein